MGCSATGACEVTQEGRHLGRHLGFYQKLEIVKKRRELKFLILDISNVTYCALLLFASSLCFHDRKKVKYTHFYSKMA